MDSPAFGQRVLGRVDLEQGRLTWRGNGRPDMRERRLVGSKANIALDMPVHSMNNHRRTFATLNILAEDITNIDDKELSPAKASVDDISHLMDNKGIQLLGQIRQGSCRPRAILFKVLADAVGLESKLVVVSGTRTTRYRAVPSKIDHRRSIEGEIDHRRSIEREKGRKKKRKKKKKKKRGEKRLLAARGPHPCAVAARESRALFLLRGEKDRGDVRTGPPANRYADSSLPNGTTVLALEEEEEGDPRTVPPSNGEVAAQLSETFAVGNLGTAPRMRRTSRGGDFFAAVFSLLPSPRLRRQGKEGSVGDFSSPARGEENESSSPQVRRRK
ncbi:hypothetical protein BHM03_00012398 [Ensete ventricosum]|nr:hypothetical protein BHM03_00012398 [Ensete ventricosum]